MLQLPGLQEFFRLEGNLPDAPLLGIAGRTDRIAEPFDQASWRPEVNEVPDRIGGNLQWKMEILKRFPLGRTGTVEDIGAAATYLACDESDWMTGQYLVVDGGHIAR